MTLSTLDPTPALVVIDLQRGITGNETTPHPISDVVGRSAVLADAFRARALPVVLVRVSIDGAGFSPGRVDRARARKIGETTTTAEVLAALTAR